MLKLVVVIPALNEEATIADVIKEIPDQLPGFHETRVVVIDDGSTDRTFELASEAGAYVIRHPVNKGVGAAFASGIERALEEGADIIVNMDGDGQFSPSDIPRLITPIVDSNYGFVTCTRFGDPDNMPKMPGIKLWGNRWMCRIINYITKKHFSDVSCGFRAYSRETALRINLFGRFTYTQETFIDLSVKNIAMTEVPLVVRGEREFGKSRVASNLYKYASRASAIIIRSFRDIQPLAFFGVQAIAFLFVGVACYGFVGVHWLITGQTSPWTSLLFVGTAGTMVGTGIGVLALVADQIGRSRMIQERMLYLARRQHYDRIREETSSALSSSSNEFENSQR